MKSLGSLLLTILLTLCCYQYMFLKLMGILQVKLQSWKSSESYSCPYHMNSKLYISVAASRAPSTPQNGPIFASNRMSGAFENPPLSGAGKHPDFQVTLWHHFVTTNVDFAYIESEKRHFFRNYTIFKKISGQQRIQWAMGLSRIPASFSGQIHWELNSFWAVQSSLDKHTPSLVIRWCWRGPQWWISLSR